MAAERRFRAMGADAHVVVVGPDGLLADAIARVEDLEARWSRFRPTSDVSRLNQAAGEPVEVAAETVTLVRRAVEAWRMTAGFVDCTMLAGLIAAGYDRSFDQLPVDRPATVSRSPRLSLVGPPDIEISGGTVRLPDGAGFDPGGIGKGLAADLVSAELLAAGAEGVCVNLGGDLRVRGRSPLGDGWTISLDHPHAGAPMALVGIVDGGIATSTDLLRRWSVGGEVRHHLIDPRTGRPAVSDVALVSALAGDAWMAEAMAKAVLLRGGDHPWDLVDGSGAEALLVRRDGAIETSAGFDAFLGGRPRVRSVGLQEVPR